MAIIMLGACVDTSDDGSNQPDTETRQSAVFQNLSVTPSTQVIDEGGVASVNINQLCVDVLDQDVTVTIDWGDGSTPDERTFPFNDFTNGGVCPSGYVAVCGEGNANCDAWEHTYKDNPSTGTDYDVNVTAVQGVIGMGGDTASQNIAVTVNNLPPDVAVSRTGAKFEGVDADFDLLVEDPALVADEIAGVTWTWTPTDQVNEPTVVHCTCANVVHCDDGTNLDVCGESNGPEVDTKSRIYLDDGNYTLEVIVTDKDGAQTTETVDTIINNRPPANLTIKIDNSLISTNSGAPTDLIEGSTYGFVGTLEEQGIDQLVFDWDLGDSTTRTGTGEVLKSSYNTIQNLAPADVLSYNYTYDNNVMALTDDYTVIFQASDDDSGVGLRTGFVRVHDVDPVINSFTANGVQGDAVVTEGGVVSFSVGAVSGAADSSFDPISTYDWDINGNGTASVPNEYTVVGCAPSDTTCEVTFLDADTNANYEVSVTVNDEDSSTSSTIREVAVNNDKVSLNSIPALPGIEEARSTTVTYSFTDAAGPLDGDYEVFVNWGDGTMPQPVATHGTPGTYTTPSHTYVDNSACISGPQPALAPLAIGPPVNPVGLCTISVVVCEAGGSICDEQLTTITVSNVTPSPAITAFPVLEEGKFFDLDGQFKDPAGDNDNLYSWTWSGLDNGDQTGQSDYASRTTGVDVTNGGRFDGPDSGTTEARTIRLTVVDGDGGSNFVEAVAQVRDNTPIISSITKDFVPTLASDEPAIGTLDITVAAETDYDLLDRVVVSWGDPNIADSVVDVSGTDSSGTSISVTAPSAYIESGVYTATVTVYDEDSSTSSTIDLTVDNVAPTIDLVEATPAAPVIVTEGQSLSVRITGSDPSTVDALALDFDIDWGDGSNDFVIGSGTGTPGEARARFSHVYTNPGVYTVNITLTDPDGGSDTSTLTVDVLNRAPSITDVFDTSAVDENTEVTAVMLVNNPGADTLSYSFNFGCTETVSGNVNDGDFAEAIPGTGTSAIGAHTYADEGEYPVCVRVCDDDGPNFGCDYGLTTVTVNNVAPTITNFPAPAPVVEDAAGADVVLTASATDVGPNDTLTYAFDCESDGSVDATNETGVATCAYTQSGMYTAKVTVTDGDGGSTFASTQVRITNAAPTISAVSALNVDEGNATTVTVAASDLGPDALVYRFDFDNDGTYDVEKSSGSATWSYPTDGAKVVGVEVCDADNACAQDSTTLTVANIAPVIASVSAPSSISRGSAVSVIVDATDQGNDALMYQFDFKDSSGATVFSIGPQSSNIATGTISDSGSYSVDVTVTDSANAPNTALTDTASTNFTVTDVNIAVSAVANPATITEGGSTTVTVTPQGTGPYLVRYDINGDGDFNDAEDIIPSGPTDTCDPCSATGITYENNRPGDLPYRVLVEVTDTGEGDAVATALVSITVNNQAPVVDAIADATIEEQSELAFTIAATDAGVNDSITYSLVSGPAGILIDANSGAFSWTPGWAAEGANSITVRATDDDGDFSEQTFTVTVTIIDTNGNGISDTRERELNNDQLLPADAGTTDTDNDGVSDLQEVLDGTDPNVSDAPSAPLVLSPDGESVDTLRPVLTVVNAESPREIDLEYTFVVLDSSGAEVTRIDSVVEGVNTTSADVDVDLAEDAVYTWYAFASDGLAQGEDSEVGEFNVNTTNSAPPAPDTLTPVDLAVLPFGVIPTLELRAVIDPDHDAVEYEFEVATDSAFSDIVTQSELRSVPFFSLSEVLEPGTYYWHGQATDGTDASGFGSYASFTIEEANTNIAPPVPTIVSPSNVVLAANSATLEIEAVVDADGDDVEYMFEIATNAAFANAENSGLQAGLTFDVTGLEEDMMYFWRVRSFDGVATSDWKSASFTVNAENSAPEGLELLSPANGVVLERAPEALTWAAATDLDGDDLTYTVELATSEDFAEILYTADFASDEAFEAMPSDVSFDAELTYYWRVTVSDGTDSMTKTGWFDLFSASGSAAVGGSESDDGCGCTSVEKPVDSRPAAGFFGFLMAGLVALRRRRRR